MDMFVERLVKKKKDATDYLISYGSIILAVVLNFIILGFLGPRSFVVFISLGMVYGVYYIITSRNIEFEYAITNGEFEIDRIIAKRKRKKLLNVSCKDFDILAKLDSNKFNKEIDGIPFKIKAVSSLYSSDVYFAVVNSQGQKKLIFFEPDSKMLNAFGKYLSKRVYEQ